LPLQVIGGRARGRRLKSPPSGVRPTAAILRRSLFDMLGARVVDAAVLDLYAGAGTLGIEALSRGAARADFVERDRRACAVIRANLAVLGEAAGGPRGRVDCAPAEKWLRARTGDEGRYDIVFLDPPYGETAVSRVLSRLSDAGLLEPGALVVLETRKGELVEAPVGLEPFRQVRHGDSELHMFAPVS
jgi:16S rRNA (guanine966-N2)-methyltransferase